MLIFRACSKNLFFCRPENLTGMRKSKRSGCPFFSPIFFGQAKTTLRVERCFSNGTKCKAQPQ
ncbi:hypothetical protein CF595_01440 [Gallibacterium anatis]|nr:hypothetical protein CF595_01440 [Gallibacterium anatis]